MTARTEPLSKTLSVNGLRLHYLEWGKPGALPVICVHGYTKTVRPPESQTQRFKFDEAYPAYEVPDGTKTELDHLVSLELGGSNDASNLWPERSAPPNPKDAVENALHAAVCSGQMSLRAAQLAIASNWMTAKARLGIG